MKLRIRLIDTNETLKIDVPSTSTLQQLKHHISQSLPSSSSNPIHLSLNRKDELLSSEEETLSSSGITSGDLIFFTFNPNGFSVPPQTRKSQPSQDSNSLNKSNTQMVKEPETVKNLDPHEGKSLNLMPQGEETEELMEVDDVDCSDMVVGVNFTKSFSVPGFLRKVFTEELSGDDGVRDHKLLAVALHAVFVESGFVLLDPVTFTESQLWKYWPSGSFSSNIVTLFYTLPEVIDTVKSGTFNVKHTVELKFHCFGKFFMAHGSLSGGVSVSTRRFNKDQLVPFLSVAWANCGLQEEVTDKDGISATSPEREVFKFWRDVKDALALPLLIDLCEKAGLELPPCFMQLPTDLKLKVLESLPSVDIAKVSCMSSELRYLASSDDLWKKKFVEQFGDAADASTSGGGVCWKEKFVRSWESRKRRKLSSRRRAFDPLRFPRGPLPFFPGPLRPHIIGGDYDLFPPPFDVTSNPLGRAPYPVLFHRLPNHVPRCDLGGHRSNIS